jgi:DNA-binding NarL/FixJ family response regulator
MLAGNAISRLRAGHGRPPAHRREGRTQVPAGRLPESWSPQRAGPGAPDDRPRVLVVDEDALAATVLHDILEQAGSSVIGLPSSAEEGLALARAEPPDVAFVDLGSADEGIALIGDLVELDSAIRCLLLTGDHSADRDLAALRAGARGSLPRADVLASDMTRILGATMDDELICARSTTTAILDQLVTAPLIASGYRPIRSPLTRREWETLDLLCASHSTDRIAELLAVTNATVRTHVKNLKRKLGARSGAELVARAGELRRAA